MPTEILDLLRGFLKGDLLPGEFADEYLDIWKALVAEQDAAIARHETVGGDLRQIRERHRWGEITDEQYSDEVNARYALLEGLRLSPAHESSEILDNLYVRADAYLSGLTDPDSALVTEEELRVAARDTLQTIQS